MNTSRNFLVIGSLYILVGMVIGAYMGGSGDHSLAPVHAHINLLGFTLSTIFAVVYRVFPTLDGSGLARLHFWLYSVAVAIMLLMLFLMMSGNVAEATAGPVLATMEGLTIISMLVFAGNVFQNAK
jgi:hypothetical protein